MITLIGILLGWYFGFLIVDCLETRQARKFLKWHEDYYTEEFKKKISDEMEADPLYKEKPMT